MTTLARVAVITLLAAAPAHAAPTFAPEAICRTALASITGHDPAIMQVTQTIGDVLFLSYLRPLDNFIWAYRCRIQGNRVLWAAEPGRWRDRPADGSVLYEVLGAGQQLRIIENHGDGTVTQDVFARDKISP